MTRAALAVALLLLASVAAAQDLDHVSADYAFDALRYAAYALTVGLGLVGAALVARKLVAEWASSLMADVVTKTTKTMAENVAEHRRILVTPDSGQVTLDAKITRNKASILELRGRLDSELSELSTKSDLSLKLLRELRAASRHERGLPPDDPTEG